MNYMNIDHKASLSIDQMDRLQNIMLKLML